MTTNSEGIETRNNPIGKTSSPFKEPNTTGVFYFWVTPNTRLNPFDFVVAEHVDGSRTIGIIDEMFAYTDSDSHLTNYIGNELGNPAAEPYVERVSAMVARAQVLRNMRNDDREELYMPVPGERSVFFADSDAIRQALGYDRILGTAIPAGLIRQSNGQTIPVLIDSDYIIGPEGAHANVSGISGLATKTSYLMFLLHSMSQKLDDFSLIIFNVKHSDLLHIHEGAEDLRPQDRRMYEQLELEIGPFENVTYFLPRGRTGQPDSDEPPRDFQIYVYTLRDVHANLDLLFAEVPDPQFTIDAFVRYVRDFWTQNRIRFENPAIMAQSVDARIWEDMQRVPDDVMGAAVYNLPRHPTPPRVKRELRRLAGGSVFGQQRGANEVYLGEAVRNNIQSGHVSVIDIYRVPAINQSFIIGDVMRNIEQMYRERELADLPKLIILIDELNTFAPAAVIPNPITEQIVEIARKGRARRTALFGAEQFKSEVHRQVWGNCALNIIGRTGSAELSTRPYGELDKYTKNSILSLKQGEMILSFRTWRYPIKVIFPKPPYRSPSRE
jgi:DNA helicase HerA-like ATPase